MNGTQNPGIGYAPDTPLGARRKRRSQFGEVFRRFKKNKLAVISFFVVLVIVFVAVFVDFLVDYETDVIGLNVIEGLQAPSAKHIFGTDELGRDLFNLVLYGTRYSLAISSSAVTMAMLIGVFLGAVAGYFGGTAENVIMRIVDIMSAIPNILMGIVIVSALGTGLPNLILAIGITSIAGFVRITRAAVLTVRNQEYVEAARAIGQTERQIILTHILPNCLSPIIVHTTLTIALAIIQASSMSFLGLGIPVPAPEWGALLSVGRRFVRSHSYLTLFPGLAIMVSVLAFNMVGDGLRDAMDPKIRR
jgi:peptide/nickel transport system permease protein